MVIDNHHRHNILQSTSNVILFSRCWDDHVKLVSSSLKFVSHIKAWWLRFSWNFDIMTAHHAMSVLSLTPRQLGNNVVQVLTLKYLHRILPCNSFDCQNPHRFSRKRQVIRNKIFTRFAILLLHLIQDRDEKRPSDTDFVYPTRGSIIRKVHSWSLSCEMNTSGAR